MKNLTVKVVDRLFIVAYGALDPTDEEWAQYLKQVEHHGVVDTMQLIYTEGGEPSAAQLRQLSNLLAGRAIPVAIISSNSRVRGTATAFSWFNRRLKAFPPSAFYDALAYVQAPERAVAVAEQAFRIAALAAAEMQGQKSLMRVSRALGVVELLVPRRIANEELGDAMEVIVRLVKQRRPSWQVCLKVATTVCWVVFNALRFSGQRAVSRKKG